MIENTDRYKGRKLQNRNDLCDVISNNNKGVTNNKGCVKKGVNRYQNFPNPTSVYLFTHSTIETLESSRFGIFIVNFIAKYFTPFSSVSIVSFEKVNVS